MEMEVHTAPSILPGAFVDRLNRKYEKLRAEMVKVLGEEAVQRIEFAEAYTFVHGDPEKVHQPSQ